MQKKKQPHMAEPGLCVSTYIYFRRIDHQLVQISNTTCSVVLMDRNCMAADLNKNREKLLWQSKTQVWDPEGQSLMVVVKLYY